MTRNRQKIMAVILATAICFAGKVTLAAYGFSFYPGTSCHCNAESDVYWTDVRVYNSDLSDSHYFYCPIIQIVEAGFTDRLGGEAYVLDENNDSNKPVECYLRCTNPASMSAYTSPTESTSSGKSSSTQWLNFDTINCATSWSASMVCVVPDVDDSRFSGIVGYLGYSY